MTFYVMLYNLAKYKVFPWKKKGFRPVGLRFRPVGLRFRPVGLRFRPQGLRSSFLGLRFRYIPSEVNLTKILFGPAPTRCWRSTLFATGKFSLVVNHRERLSRIMKINREMYFCYEKWATTTFLFASIPFEIDTISIHRKKFTTMSCLDDRSCKINCDFLIFQSISIFLILPGHSSILVISLLSSL